MSLTNNGNAKFRTKWGFILSAVGSAVGMANVWGFSYKVGQNGGGAFLFAYMIFIILFSYVGLSTEYAVGRRARTGTVGAYEKAWQSGGKGGIGKFVGWLPLAGSMGIALGYAVIIAYVCRAFIHSLTGNLMTVETGPWFESFALKTYSVIPYHIIVVVGTLLTLYLGAKSIERTNKIMMPLFFVIFVILAIRVALLPGAIEGYKFMFTPVWSQLLDPMVWIWAMGQAFFSLSMTGSGMIVYGAYLSDNEDVISGARYTALFDTIAAFVAGIVIIPACFAYKVDVGSGPGLLFVTLPRILQDIPLGRLFAIILYSAMIFAGVSSMQNMFEVIGESLLYKIPKLKRTIMLAVLCVICLGIGVNMEAIFHWGPWMDLVSIYIIPIGATLGAVSWFWIMKKDDLLDEINKGSPVTRGNLWYRLGKYVYVPLAVVLCLIALFKQISF